MEPNINEQATTLTRFMKARHAIYTARSAGAPAPWTDDPVLAAYRFCNVYREFDTVTIWIRKNIRERFPDHKYLWFMLALARQINHPETLAELLADKRAWPEKRWEPERARQIMLARQARGEKVYTGAYMLYGGNNSLNPERDKPNFTTKVVLAPLWQDRDSTLVRGGLLKNLENFVTILRNAYTGWGGFMAYEVACDVRHTAQGAGWTDVNTFAHAGPGALRGLNRLAGAPVKARIPEPDALARMRALLPAVQRQWHRPSRTSPRLELREIEHSLCEFDKYERARLGQGAPRSKYTPAERPSL